MKTIKLLLITISFMVMAASVYGQARYSFNYQYFNFDRDEMVFVDTVLKKSYHLDFDGSITVGESIRTINDIKYLRSNNEPINEAKFLSLLEESTITYKSAEETLQLQKVDSTWIFLELDYDYNDIDFEPVTLTNVWINDDLFVIANIYEGYEAIFIVHQKEGLLGIREEDEFEDGKRLKLKPEHKEIMNEEIKERFPNFKREHIISQFGFFDQSLVLIDTSINAKFELDFLDVFGDFATGVYLDNSYAGDFSTIPIVSNMHLKNLESVYGNIFRDT